MKEKCIALSVLSIALLVPALRGQEPTRDDLIRAAREIMNDARYCGLVTLDQTGAPRVRSMQPFAPEDDMAVWMITSRQTRKVNQIRNDARVALYYQDAGGDGYVFVQGRARLVDDPEEKKRRWREDFEQYFQDRSTYVLIRIVPQRLELVSYKRELVGDPATWRPLAVEFQGGLK